MAYLEREFTSTVVSQQRLAAKMYNLNQAFPQSRRLLSILKTSLLSVLCSLRPQGTERRVLSSDLKTVKIWNRDDGTVLTNVETPADINDVCVAHDARCGCGWCCYWCCCCCPCVFASALVVVASRV